MKRQKTAFLILAAILLLSSLQYTHAEIDKARNGKPGPGNDVLGIGILSRLPGLWNGPVSSTTPAGSFPAWYVDFRPVAPGQISQYSTLDADTLNYTSFFIVKHENQLKVAMRTEGVFQNKGCVTYEVIDTVNEPEGYYRFSDFQRGDKRAFTEFRFKNDELVMEVYTNKFNKEYPLKLHSRWVARRADKNAAAGAISHFNFPQPVMVKDFSNIFSDMSESIYYTFEKDPYSSRTQPYVGQVTVQIAIDEKIAIKKNYEIFLLFTTEPLFEGLKYNKDNLKYISKLVYLPIGTRSYTFKNIHPGKYYVYSYIDINNDRKHLSGDYMSSDTNNTFILKEKGESVVHTKIDFLIP